MVNNAGKVTLAPMEFMPLATFEDQLQVRGESVCAWSRRRGGEGRCAKGGGEER